MVDQISLRQENKSRPLSKKRVVVTAIAALLVVVLNVGFIRAQTGQNSKAYADQHRLVNIYADGQKKFIITGVTKVEDALRQAEISIAQGDVVEPSLNSDINHPTFNINIHRALPAVIVDNNKKTQVLTGHHSPNKIVEAAGIKVFSEDKVEFDGSAKLAAENVTGRNVKIIRAKVVNLNIDDQLVQYRTQLDKISDFISEKDINISENQTIEPGIEGLITDGMTINVKTKKPEKIYSMGAYSSSSSNMGVYRASGDAWQLLRFCEAGGDYSRNSGNGFYGAYQFNLSTWGNYGGYRFPHEAPPEVQDAKARDTQARRGWNPWPACSRKLGL